MYEQTLIAERIAKQQQNQRAARSREQRLLNRQQKKDLHIIQETEQTWKCHMCTSINEAGAEECFMCNTISLAQPDEPEDIQPGLVAHPMSNPPLSSM